MGIFERIFGTRSPTQESKYTYLQGLNDWGINFTPWNGNLFDNDIAKSAIGSNARNIAKLSPVHIRRTEDNTINSPNVRISRMLKYPNEFSNIYSFLEKVATHYFIYNNAIIYFDRENYKLYPILPGSIQLLEDGKHNIYAKFQFKLGCTATIPFEDLVVIKRFYNKDDFFGDKDNPLKRTMEVVDTTDQGVVNAIKRSNGLLGLLKFNGTVRKEDRDKEVSKFEDSYLKNNSGGIAATDAGFEFQKLDIKPFVPTKAQSEWSEDRIYSYLGTNKKIIQGNFTEEEWSGYYETTIEPFAIQASLALTRVIFSDYEIGHNNEIFFESNRLQYANTTSKIAVARLLTDIGAAEIDQILDIFNLPRIGGKEGKRRVQTLNMVSAKLADKYQVGKEEKDSGGTEDT